MSPTQRITSLKKTKINNLVNHVKEYLPLNTYSGRGATIESIFAESNVEIYLVGNNKTEIIQNGFTNLFRYHQRLPKKIIEKIVPAAIEYRRFKRNPIKREEIDKLNSLLLDLDINLESDLRSINLNESLPVTLIPPKTLLASLRKYNLIVELRGEVLDLFENGHYNEAIRKAAEKFENKVQNKSRLTEIGKSLMGKVFNIANPILRTSALSSENEKAFQEGYQLITMGMMQGIRNIFSHGDEDPRTPEECYEMLIFLNWLFRKLNDIS
ncbi:MAG: TIGR02391 family protein [Saprospiraceae bacterium]